MKSMLESIFGCQHRNLSWPQSPRREDVSSPFEPVAIATVKCNSCGAVFVYHLDRMRIGRRIPESATPTLEQEVASERADA